MPAINFIHNDITNMYWNNLFKKQTFGTTKHLTLNGVGSVYLGIKTVDSGEIIPDQNLNLIQTKGRAELGTLRSCFNSSVTYMCCDNNLNLQKC